ncbi:MAG: hypothetical protein LBC61_01980 [Candidatus Peribacteria bacterium]|nr:hypothetical protein [Candidatus Peribacteria bacterium]
MIDLKRSTPEGYEKLIRKEEREYKEREEKLNKIRKVLEEKRDKYLKKIEKERFEIRFKKIKTAIDNLI